MDSGADPSSTAPTLRANRDFRIILVGQAVSALGDAVSITVMPLLVLFLTGSAAQMGVVAALQLLPDLGFGLVAGALADRWDRRAMIMWADAGRALLTAAIPVSYWLDLPTMSVVFVVALPINVLRLLSDAALTSAMPTLVGRDQLGRANSYIEATLSLPFIAGPAAAGLLVAGIGPASTLAIDAASFLCSSASMCFVRSRLRAERGQAIPRLWSDIRAGIQFVWQMRALRAVIAYWTAIAVATSGVVPTLTYYITIDRQRGAELFGYVGSTWSVGYLAGSLLAGRLRRPRIGLRILIAGAAIAPPLLVIASTTSTPTYLGAAAVIGAALAVLLVSYATLRSTLTPDDYLGRVGSTARTLSLGLQPAGLLVTSALIESTDGRTALLTIATVVLAITASTGLSPTIRNLSTP